MNKLIKGSFYKIKNPYYKIAVGGLILGLLVFLFPSLYGEGYLTINSLLKGDHTAIISNSIFSQFSDLPFVVIVFAVVTVMFKSVATLVTLAAGGNGGTFAPSLIIGGMLGFIIAYTVNLLGIAELNVANFIVAGMAAALGSVMHAPLTGIFLIAEITGGYVLMVPLMITTAIAYFISRGVSQYSIYTKPLVDAGHLSHHEAKDTTVLNMMSLKSLIEKDQLILKDTDFLSDRITAILNSKRNVIPVVNENEVFQGVVYIETILAHVSQKSTDNILIKEITDMPAEVAALTNDVKEVLKKMEQENLWVMPVVDYSGAYVGLVSKTNIFNKYRSMLSRQS
ncbi:Voltage-gated ClC-type chloride channel ClcB [compost metagenome]